MRVLLVALAVILVACGSDEPEETRAALVEWLSADSGAGLELPVAECVADELSQDLSDDEVAELVEVDTEGLSPEELEQRVQPERMRQLTEAGVRCEAIVDP